ncbi:hypothetical protein DRN69_00185 [Candidatus Pacearchaeota archaeon]|nr:MAG: hypothetical protein DRN69_00185 [Candidatus Pacearchaeota archaeon]
MLNLSLLVNEKELLRFCKTVVPELKKDEVLIAMIVARKKYGEISRSEEILDKTILKESKPEYIIRKLRKLGYVEECYIDFNTGQTIPSKCIAMYIDLSPKSTIRAFNLFNKEINEWAYQAITSDKFDIKTFRKIDTKLFSALARSTSRQPYFIIDIDNKDKKTLNNTIELLKEHIVWISETRGGYHIITRKNNESGYIIHNNLNNKENIEIFSKQGQTPVPGSLQGGFLVRGIRR